MGQAIYYTTIIVCAFGCISRILLAGYYRILLRALKSMKTTKNKWMQKLKEQFILRYQAMLGVQNVESFVDKFFSERRILGIPVTAWTGLHIQLVSVCLLLGALEAMNLVRHKTKKWYFHAVNLLGLAWQLALLVYLALNPNILF